MAALVWATSPSWPNLAGSLPHEGVNRMSKRPLELARAITEFRRGSSLPCWPTLLQGHRRRAAAVGRFAQGASCQASYSSSAWTETATTDNLRANTSIVEGSGVSCGDDGVGVEHLSDEESKSGRTTKRKKKCKGRTKSAITSSGVSTRAGPRTNAVVKVRRIKVRQLRRQRKLKSEPWLPFDEARQFVSKLGLKSLAEWKEYCASGQRPLNIPACPCVTYKHSGWRGYRHWLGSSTWRLAEEVVLHSEDETEEVPTGRSRRTVRASYEQAVTFVHKLGLKSQKEWLEWTRVPGNLPEDVPKNPYVAYMGKGWIDWPHFLGYERRRRYASTRQQQRWLPFEEARAWARSLKLSGRDEWSTMGGRKQLPHNVPAAPDQVYGSQWQGYRDWLGLERWRLGDGQERWVPYDMAQEFMHTQGLQSAKEWREWCLVSENRPEDLPSEPNRVYKGKGWVSWPVFLGYKPKRYYSRALGEKSPKLESLVS
mmetsp:Transcript_3237/g.11732  ORF Transcript_3237/g.11732 Transcript_3237/m.11732 type:complete len:483 (-) Transcript_3237:123-1571(-)